MQSSLHNKAPSNVPNGAWATVIVSGTGTPVGFSFELGQRESQGFHVALVD